MFDGFKSNKCLFTSIEQLRWFLNHKFECKNLEFKLNDSYPESCEINSEVTTMIILHDRLSSNWCFNCPNLKSLSIQYQTDFDIGYSFKSLNHLNNLTTINSFNFKVLKIWSELQTIEGLFFHLPNLNGTYPLIHTLKTHIICANYSTYDRLWLKNINSVFPNVVNLEIDLIYVNVPPSNSDIVDYNNLKSIKLTNLTYCKLNTWILSFKKVITFEIDFRISDEIIDIVSQEFLLLESFKVTHGSSSRNSAMLSNLITNCKYLKSLDGFNIGEQTFQTIIKTERKIKKLILSNWIDTKLMTLLINLAKNLTEIELYITTDIDISCLLTFFEKMNKRSQFNQIGINYEAVELVKYDIEKMFSQLYIHHLSCSNYKPIF